VNVFWPENSFEFMYVHAASDLVLWLLLVVCKLEFPLICTHGRQQFGRLPVGNGQARLSQSSVAAQQHHRLDVYGYKHQLVRYFVPVVKIGQILGYFFEPVLIFYH